MDKNTSEENAGSSWSRRIGLFIRDYSQLLSGLTIGACSLGAAMIISGGVQTALEEDEAIAVTGQGFTRSAIDRRRVLAHNYGGRSGTLLGEITIIVKDRNNKEIGRPKVMLNPGVSGGTSKSPFTLPKDQGIRYFLHPVELPENANSCIIEFQVMRHNQDPRGGKSPPFDCK